MFTRKNLTALMPIFGCFAGLTGTFGVLYASYVVTGILGGR